MAIYLIFRNKSGEHFSSLPHNPTKAKPLETENKLFLSCFTRIDHTLVIQERILVLVIAGSSWRRLMYCTNCTVQTGLKVHLG